MDTPAGGSGRGGSASGGRGRGSKDARGGRGAVNSRTSSRVVQNLQNYVSGGPVGKTQSKNMATLKIHGMSNSKATGNPDGGLRSLLTFLERKASKDKPITIGKVYSPIYGSPQARDICNYDKRCVLTHQ